MLINNLPTDLLVAILSHLSTEERAAFCSCCRGHVELGRAAPQLWQQAVVHSATQHCSLAHWLHGKRDVLRRLELTVRGSTQEIRAASVSLLHALQGSDSLTWLHITWDQQNPESRPRHYFVLGANFQLPQLEELYLDVNGDWTVEVDMDFGHLGRLARLELGTNCHPARRFRRGSLATSLRHLLLADEENSRCRASLIADGIVAAGAHLQSLHIAAPRLGAACVLSTPLVDLSSLTALTSLSLSEKQCMLKLCGEDVALRTLAGLKELSVMGLSMPLSHLSALSALSRLQLQGGGDLIIDPGLLLWELPSLKALSITRVFACPGGFSAPPEHCQLEELIIDCKYAWAANNQLMQLYKLRKLELTEVPLTTLFYRSWWPQCDGLQAVVDNVSALVMGLPDLQLLVMHWVGSLQNLARRAPQWGSLLEQLRQVRPECVVRSSKGQCSQAMPWGFAGGLVSRSGVGCMGCAGY